MIKYRKNLLYNKLKEACWTYHPSTIFETSIYNGQYVSGKVVAMPFPTVLHCVPLL